MREASANKRTRGPRAAKFPKARRGRVFIAHFFFFPRAAKCGVRRARRKVTKRFFGLSTQVTPPVVATRLKCKNSALWGLQAPCQGDEPQFLRVRSAPEGQCGLLLRAHQKAGQHARATVTNKNTNATCWIHLDCQRRDNTPCR